MNEEQESKGSNMIGAISAGVQAATGLVGGIMNAVNQHKQLQYQKQLQQQLFQREDTAVQRRAADLQAAGLSQTLAAGGGAGAGPVVKTEAPQLNIPDNVGGALQNARMNDLQIDQAEEAKKLTMEQIKSQQAQQSVAAADRELKSIEAEVQRWNLDLSKAYNMKTTDAINLPNYLMRQLAPNKKDGSIINRLEDFADRTFGGKKK